MPYNIAISTKILTLATSPILFILVGVLSVKFAMVPGVYILLCPQEEEHQNHQKDLNPLSLHYYGKVTVELKKKSDTKKKLNCVYGPCNLIK